MARLLLSFCFLFVFCCLVSLCLSLHASEFRDQRISHRNKVHRQPNSHSVLPISRSRSFAPLKNPLPQVAPGSDALYGITTGVNLEGTELIVQTVAVNTTSGNLSYLLTNFIYTTGFSITEDGITTLDEETGMLFYSTDFEDSFIWTALVTGAPSLQAPIDIGAYAIVDLKTDTKGRRLFIAFEDQYLNAYLAVYYLNGSGASLLNNFTTTFNGKVSIGASTLGASNEKWYFIALPENGVQELAALNLTDQKLVQHTLNGNCQITEGGFSFLFYENKLKSLWGIQESFANETLTYYVASFSKNFSSCTQSMIDMGFGIVTTSAYSPVTGNLYFVVAPDGPPLVCTIPITANLPPVVTPTCVVTPNLLSDLVAYNPDQ